MTTHEKYRLQLLADILKKVPWLVTIARFFWRLRQPRFTVGVVGVVFNAHDEVLLVEHVFHPQKPWGLPGGWVDKNEPPATAVIREFAEELGIVITIQQLLLVDLAHRHHLDVAYLCRQETGIKTLSNELLNHGWFDTGSLPKLQRFHRKAIAHGLEAQQKMSEVV